MSQWNSVRVLPSPMMEEGIEEVTASKPIFDMLVAGGNPE
jgi:hypothetical protein